VKDVNAIALKMKFLGGAREVGRVAIALETKKTMLLLDYGVMLNHEPGFPMHVSPKEVDGIVLTHREDSGVRNPVNL
jgi:putative mRNA 3-end processing factor